ncbi:type II toxin-antitoxin system Phd/YefM family antitoxin [uncultured Thiodictyon sp.]|uniref:type II toxin-antitoxin system Phd/YefM family antitoxin n=1 Tax=uncultured Thiodictyon sp. TaxID=1846217 RepID=UPI0025F7B36A|nr:type II toxin-antitoxin system Phd/YefM family antitoxin [uncultured Thiodictyon sp.]
MSDTSIVNAKARLPSLVQRAEAGELVHITRRGKRVTVILSEREFNRLTAIPPKLTGYLQFLANWRKRLQADGSESLTGQEVASLRSRETGRDFSWDQ